MRDSLKRSIADSPVPGFERYPAGSIVICHACALPIFKLDRAISLGDKAGQAASAFKPLTVADLFAVIGRLDVDSGVRAKVRGMTPEQRQAHVRQLREMRAGDPMLCPACKDCFVQVLSIEQHEVLDKAYTIEMLTIPPVGYGRPAPIRGKSPGKDWIH